MNIVENDIAEKIHWLSSFGGLDNGGITRQLYSKEWMCAQNALKHYMQSMNIATYFDDVGNLFGRVEGTANPEQVIMSGSHIDTVVNGGRFDGQLGIVGALLAIQYLYQTYGRPLKTLELVSIAEEEGSRFPYTYWGSKNIFNQIPSNEVDQLHDKSGISFIDAMNECEFTFNTRPPRKGISAFIELHIEQGCVLEKEQQQIGIVSSIVGQRRYTIKLTGQANHAGTTPMSYRKDAMYGFSRICQESIEQAKRYGDPLVLTFGNIAVSPNVVNVVPGEVIFSIDCRHTEESLLTQFAQELERNMRYIASDIGLSIDINLWMNEKPVPMNKQLIEILVQQCQQSDLKYKIMPSGAGHDSQIFAAQVPTAMIFVPSINGISHNPAENTSLNDLLQGVKLLASTLYQLAYK